MWRMEIGSRSVSFLAGGSWRHGFSSSEDISVWEWEEGQGGEVGYSA